MIKFILLTALMIGAAGATADSETNRTTTTKGDKRWQTPPVISNEIIKYPDAVNRTWNSENCSVYIYTIKTSNFSSNYTLLWKKGKDQVTFMLRDNGTICQCWDFGGLLSVAVILKSDSFYENWRIEDKVMQVFKRGQTKVSTWTDDRSDVDGLKLCRRYISEWCEANSHWVKIPCKIYQKIEDEEES